MPNLMPFQFHHATVSTIVDDQGEPWFIAADVCAVLELKNVSQVLTRLKAYEKNTIRLNDALHSELKTLIVNESGFYKLVLRSRKKIADEFSSWVTEEVLPTIRKTGQYHVSTSASRGDMLVQMAEAYREQERRLAAIEAAHQDMQSRRLEDQAALIASQQRAIEALQLATNAESKASLALEDAHTMTIETFIVRNGLLTQFPPAQWPGMVPWVKSFCQTYNLKVAKQPTPGKFWADENAYPIRALMAWLDQATRRGKQIRLVETPTQQDA